MIGIQSPEFALGLASLPQDVSVARYAALTNGRVAVAYQSYSAVYVALFNPANGAVTEVAQLTGIPYGTFFTYGVREPAIAALGGGGFVVGYNRPVGNLLEDERFTVQVYGAAGAPVGGPVEVFAGWMDDFPTLHGTGTGFVSVVTERETVNGVSSREGRVQFHAADGTAIGTPTLIPGFPGNPADLVTLDNGTVVLGWQTTAAVSVQRFAANGNALGGPITVASGSLPIGRPDTTLLALDGGGFGVVFLQDGALKLARFNASGAPVGSVVDLEAAVAGAARFDGRHHAIQLDDGTIAVAFGVTVSGIVNRGTDVYVAYYTRTGQKITDPILATANVVYDQFDPSFVKLPDGRVMLNFVDDMPPTKQGKVKGVVIKGPDSVFIGGNGPDNRSGGPGDDVLRGNGGNDILRGLGGDDLLSGGDGNDRLDGGPGADQLSGDAGNDTLLGGDGADRLFGGEGNDSAEGGKGADTIDGGAGNDTLKGQAGNDQIFGGAGDDVIDGGPGNDLLDGGEGNDRIDGKAGNDTIYGGAGDDRLAGGGGADTIEGGAGRDTIFGGDGNDALYGGDDNDNLNGGKGNDILNGGGGDDTLKGDGGNDILAGALGDDLLFGGAGNDSLLGGQGNDRLFGGGGNDTLVGASGNDTLTGGAGRDTFMFTAFNAEGAIGDDRITDFTPGQDRLDFTGFGLTFGTTLIAREVGAGLRLSFGGNSVTLVGVTLATFDQSDLIL